MNVLVAMSGGVDSSVAAALLLEAGHEVTGVTLRLWGGDTDSGCCSVGDVEDARRVAAQLGVPHYVFNLTEQFEDAVVAPYVDAYAAGRTPNPCVECNRSIKFGVLLQRAQVLGFDAVATGHHARVIRDSGGSYQLLRGHDAAKDQSYVLYMLCQSELQRVVLPVGELTKAEVRAHASRLGLRTASKAESMDVCFVARDERRHFLSERVGRAPGDRTGAVVDVSGQWLAQHDGVEHYTVGQRRGLGVASGERNYVVDVDAATSTVTIGRRSDLLRQEIEIRNITWVAEPVPAGRALDVQYRAHGAVVRGHFVAKDRLALHEPQPRVAPGQVVAWYDGDALLGGGIAA